MDDNKNKIFYHEDFYRQKELIPEENYFISTNFIDSIGSELNSELGNFEAISRELHNQNATSIRDRKIPLSDVAKAIDPIAYNYFITIETGYGNKSVLKKDMVVWGFEYYGLFVEFNSDQIVTSIWIGNSPLFYKNNEGLKLMEALTILGLKYKLILIDWDSELIVRIINLNATKRYLKEILNFDIY